jgi:hypothetical protein
MSKKGGNNTAAALATPMQAPNYSALAGAATYQSQLAAAAEQDRLNWAKEQYAQDRGVTNQVVDAALNRQNQYDQWASQDRNDYNSRFKPLEDNLINDAAGYTDERNIQRANTAAGRATADVSSQFEVARKAAQDRLESYGVDPSQTRSAALDTSARMQEAAARASAANTTRDTTRREEEATGRDLRAQAINLGQAGLNRGIQYAGTATQAGNQAVNAGIATTATGAQTAGTPTQWGVLGVNNLNSAGSLQNDQFKNQLSANSLALQASKQDNERSSGVGGLVGTGVGLVGGSVFGGPAGAQMGSQLGGAIGKAYFAEGGYVDPSLSPSGGAVTDDVTADVGAGAGGAQINAGEYVIPRDVVQKKGTDWFERLIENARNVGKAQGQNKNTQPGNQQAIPMGAC